MTSRRVAVLGLAAVLVLAGTWYGAGFRRASPDR
jgi:hypothetical protein